MRSGCGRQNRRSGRLRLITGGAGDAGGDDTVADGVKLFMGGFLQSLCRGLAVDGVDHHLLRGDGFDSFQPRGNIFLSRIINRLASA